MVVFTVCVLALILCCLQVMYVFLFSYLGLVMVTEWPSIGKIAAHSA